VSCPNCMAVLWNQTTISRGGVFKTGKLLFMGPDGRKYCKRQHYNNQVRKLAQVQLQGDT
jgi:hypothetical protein